MLEIILLPPVMKGFISLMVVSAVFPISGVMILRMNLLQMRFMLTHGVILGGALSLVIGAPQLPVIIAVNLLVVLLLIKLSDDDSGNPGRISVLLMVLTIGLAGILMHKFKVAARDTLSILWGSPFTLNVSDMIIILFIAAVLLIYAIAGFSRMNAVFFNADLAQSAGVNVRLHRTMIIIIISLTTAAAIKLMGALLVDALIILPAFIAASFSGSLKKSLINASLLGAVFGFGGFYLSVQFDLPLSGSISILGGAAYLLVRLRRKSL
ncbi:MAG: metal ABC transporter permease [Spirochaetales bacterium]|nr:metal ABC transporter permease [Spirochaetales bacterium]